MNRARSTFWALVGVAAVAMGGLSKALAAPPGPATGLGVALSATTLALSLVLAGRILLRLDTTGRSENRSGSIAHRCQQPRRTLRGRTAPRTR